MTEAPLRVLAVISDAALRQSIVLTLTEGGHEVVEAADGSTGLALAAGRPDVIVVDGELADLSGSVVCHRLKTSPATALIPVLQLASDARPSHQDGTGLSASADGRMPHPVEPAALLRAVTALAARERLSQLGPLTDEESS
jgi:CheY-like chemotaxis protein